MRRALSIYRLAGSMLLATTLLLTASCAPPPSPGGAYPEEAVRNLNTHLVNNDLAAFARAALPPELHAQLIEAWQAGRTRWPLDEMPFATEYPKILAALSADNARAELMAGFEQEVANSSTLDFHQSALLMSVFMVQYIQHQSTTLFSEHERAHYSQLFSAAGQWASTAPLNDLDRAGQVLDLLIPVARKTHLGSDAAMAKAGMKKTLRYIAPVIAAFKQSLTLYGLDIDAMLSAAQIEIFTETDDKIEVEMRYQLDGHEISAIIPVEQINGRWYVSDFIRHVQDAIGTPDTTDGADSEIPVT